MLNQQIQFYLYYLSIYTGLITIFINIFMQGKSQFL